MATPLYKSLKSNGITFYALPGAEEDLNQDRQNENFKLYFNKFVLLHLPKQGDIVGYDSNDDQKTSWDFDNFFSSSPNSVTDFGDRIIESLRNYVANHEVVSKDTKINNNEYFYNNEILSTITEKVFFKWCKKLNLIQFEHATPDDEYFSGLDEFASNDTSDDSYFPEKIWKEREVYESNIISFKESGETGYANKLEVEYQGTINYNVGDLVIVENITNNNFPEKTPNVDYVAQEFKILNVLEPTVSLGYRVIFDKTYTGSEETESNGTSKLKYHRLVQYIGEVSATNNVQNNNKSYVQAYAHIADNVGATPDILFRTSYDDNYKPNLVYPILPAQYQPEINGAENFNSPIIKNPQNYPGDHYAQYDNDDNLNEYKYINTTGDILRRSGNYYGISGNINNISYDGSNLDGVGIDFDRSHYVKMNILNEEVNNFDEFNSKYINNEAPEDFEFNAIAWFYTVEDINGNTSTNLYGIQILDNPLNNNVVGEIKIPTYKKIVSDGNQTGTAYQFSLNLNTIISNDTEVITNYDKDSINTLFGFNLYNEAMKHLININDAFSTSIDEHNEIINQQEELKQLLYSQSSIEEINKKIKDLNDLLKLYSTNQIVSTDSVKVTKDNSQSPPEIKLYATDSGYSTVTNVTTSSLYSSDGVIPYNVNVPDGKDFLIRIVNDDTTELTLNNDEVLTIFLEKDLAYKQSVDIIVETDDTSTQNKKFKFMINTTVGNQLPILTDIVPKTHLPVGFNEDSQETNTSYKWNNISINISQFKLNTDGETIGIFVNTVKGLAKGDSVYLNNFYMGVTNPVKFDTQFIIDSVDSTNNIINVDYNTDSDISAYINQLINDGDISAGDTIDTYNSIATVTFNKGYKYTITRVLDSIDSSFEDRYVVKKIVY